MNAPRGASSASSMGSRSLVTITAVAVLLLAVVSIAPPAEAQGRQYKLEGLNGGELGPGDFTQGVIIAVVWASWSPRGKDVVDRTNSIVDRWGSQARVIMVNFQEDSAAVQSFLGGTRTKAPVYLDSDGAFSKRYSVTNLPGLVVFKDGNTAFSGKLPNNPDQLISQTLG